MWLSRINVPSHFRRSTHQTSEKGNQISEWMRTFSPTCLLYCSIRFHDIKWWISGILFTQIFSTLFLDKSIFFPVWIKLDCGVSLLLLLVCVFYSSSLKWKRNANTELTVVFCSVLVKWFVSPYLSRWFFSLQSTRQK